MLPGTRVTLGTVFGKAIGGGKRVVRGLLMSSATVALAVFILAILSAGLLYYRQPPVGPAIATPTAK